MNKSGGLGSRPTGGLIQTAKELVPKSSLVLFPLGFPLSLGLETPEQTCQSSTGSSPRDLQGLESVRAMKRARGRLFQGLVDTVTTENNAIG